MLESSRTVEQRTFGQGSGILTQRDRWHLLYLTVAALVCACTAYFGLGRAWAQTGTYYCGTSLRCPACEPFSTFCCNLGGTCGLQCYGPGMDPCPPVHDCHCGGTRYDGMCGQTGCGGNSLGMSCSYTIASGEVCGY